MIDIDKEIEKINEQAKRNIDVLLSVKEILGDVNWISTVDVYLNEVSTYEEFIAQLHRISSKLGNYELKNYYVSDLHALAIWYNFGDLSVGFYVQDMENTLSKISKGKCRLEKSTKTAYGVVCQMEE